MEPPPCLVPGQPMNACARSVYAFEINGIAHLHGPWAGWRLAGNVLVTPDRDRITPAVLAHIIHRWRLELKAGLQGDGASRI